MVVSLVGFAFVVWRHRSNIARLFRGEEPRIGKGGLALASLRERMRQERDRGRDEA